MIGYLRGKVKYVSEGFIIIDCNGVGYRVNLGEKNRPQPIGGEKELYIYTHVRENELALFGFEKSDELDLFEMLIDVSGVGPKVAVSLVSRLGAKKLVSAILLKDASGLKIPGVGPKTANKIILELADKLEKRGYQTGRGEGTALKRSKKFDKSLEEARAALRSLGYSAGDIKKVLDTTRFSAKDQNKDTGDLVKYILSKM